MRPLWIAAALLAVQPRAAIAEAPSEALVERFLAVIPDRHEIDSATTEIDPGELSGLVALNPGKEAQLRPILEANLACSGPAISAVSLRMLRSVANDLGEARLKRLVSFYEGPDFVAFSALAARIEGNPAPSPADKAAMAKLMDSYPLRDFYERMERGDEMIGGDGAFVRAIMKCTTEQEAALQAAGLRSR